MTRFEKIRSMDKKELSVFLKDFSEVNFADYCENRPECEVTVGTDPHECRPCEQCIENWLSEEC